MSEHPEGLMKLATKLILELPVWMNCREADRARERFATVLAPLWSERDELRRMNATIEHELRPLAASLLVENDWLRAEIARLREEADDESK